MKIQFTIRDWFWLCAFLSVLVCWLRDKFWGETAALKTWTKIILGY